MYFLVDEKQPEMFGVTSRYYCLILFNISNFNYYFLTGLVWFVGFYGISTFVGYLMPNPFFVNNLFYLKQLTLA